MFTRLTAENKVYAQSFRFSQEGHAVWPKALNDDLKPGACGYVNGYGNWVTIIQLTDAAKIQELGLAPLEGISEMDDGGNTSWTKKVSEKVNGAGMTLDANVM